MAVLTAGQLVGMRQPLADLMASRGLAMNVDKVAVNEALQAIEDVFEGAAFQNGISSAINGATSPVTWSAAQKKALVRAYLVVKLGLY